MPPFSPLIFIIGCLFKHRAGQNGYIQMGNKFFETVEQFKYWGTNQNSIHAEIQSRLKSGNAFICDIPCIFVYDCNNFTNTCTIHLFITIYY
jgi:hypothetical protein